jgi:diadenosine tetraphosphate (Ap4A) HIT family hydrolase
MTGRFTLHDRLRSDTVEIASWPLSLLLMMNTRQWPWLILVPQRPGVREIHDLEVSDRARLIEEIARASRCLETLFQPTKINVGALGNLVPQLHIHVIARFTDDPAWPRPVWGAVAPEPYAPEALKDRIRQITAALGEGSSA